MAAKAKAATTVPIKGRGAASYVPGRFEVTTAHAQDDGWNSLHARDETDPSTWLRTSLDALLAELVRVVDETLQPEHVSVWLRKQ